MSAAAEHLWGFFLLMSLLLSKHLKQRILSALKMSFHFFLHSPRCMNHYFLPVQTAWLTAWWDCRCNLSPACEWVNVCSVTVSVSGRTDPTNHKAWQEQSNLDVETNIVSCWSLFLTSKSSKLLGCFSSACTVPSILSASFLVPDSVCGCSKYLISPLFRKWTHCLRVHYIYENIVTAWKSLRRRMDSYFLCLLIIWDHKVLTFVSLCCWPRNCSTIGQCLAQDPAACKQGFSWLRMRLRRWTTPADQCAEHYWSC